MKCFCVFMCFNIYSICSRLPLADLLHVVPCVSHYFPLVSNKDMYVKFPQADTGVGGASGWTKPPQEAVGGDRERSVCDL